jgi:hypothetical protein
VEWLEIYCLFVWDSKRTKPSKLSTAAGYSSCLTVLLQIKPLVQPTIDIMREPIRTFQWHEFFPHGICHEIHILHFDNFFGFLFRFNLQELTILVLLYHCGLQ